MKDRAAKKLERAFLEAAERSPLDPAPKLAYSDWLAERGEDCLAYAWRWAARRGRAPAKEEAVEGPRGVRFVWHCRDAWSRRRLRPSDIPEALFDAMAGGRWGRPALRDAFIDLAKALRDLQAAVSLEERP